MRTCTAALRLGATLAVSPTERYPAGLLCANSQGRQRVVKRSDSRLVRLDAAGRGRFEEFLNAIFKVFLAREPHMDRSDFSGLVNQEGGGQRIHAAVELSRGIVADHHA